MPIGSSGDLLSFIAAGTAGAVGERFFQCLVEHLALAFGADVAFAAELAPDCDDRATFLACWESGALIPEPAAYELAGTPCSEFGESDLVTYVGGLPARYPDDRLIVEQGLESYLGVAVRDSAGTRIGHVGVLARAPVQPDRERVDVLRIFAARAGAEIERRRREAMFREIADEHAALRRVATLVAAEGRSRRVRQRHARGRRSCSTPTDRAWCAGTANGRTSSRRGAGRASWRRASARSTGSTPALRPAARCISASRPVPTGSSTARTRASSPWAFVLRSPRRSASAAGCGASCAPRARALTRSAMARSGGSPTSRSSSRRRSRTPRPATELAASRLRIVEAGDTERRRIERNLHDGAQQRLVSLRLALTLAAKQPRRRRAAGPVVAAAAEELAVALEELRELARGIHPAILSDHGLVAAVEALSARSPVQVEVAAATIGQLPEASRGNRLLRRRRGADERREVRRRDGGHGARFTRRRRGCASRSATTDAGERTCDAGSGLRGLDDRVQALGGTLRIASPAGGGTVVTAEIPAAARGTSQRPRIDVT